MSEGYYKRYLFLCGRGVIARSAMHVTARNEAARVSNYSLMCETQIASFHAMTKAAMLIT